MTILLLALIAFVQPFVLKFCAIHWQIVINSIGAVVYFVSALVLWNAYGLKGFCIGTIIGAASRLLVMLIVYYSVGVNEEAEDNK